MRTDHRETTLSVVLDTAQHPYLGCYRVNGDRVLPLGAALEIALAVDPARRPLVGVTIDGYVPVPADGRVPLTIATSENGFDIGSTIRGAYVSSTPGPAPADVTALLASKRDSGDEMSGPAFYGRLAAVGITCDELVRCIERVWSSEGDTIVQLLPPASNGSAEEEYRIHPVVLEACVLSMSLTASVAHGIADGSSALPLPASLDALRFFAPTRAARYLRIGPVAGGRVNATLLDGAGNALMEIGGLAFSTGSAHASEARAAPRNGAPPVSPPESEDALCEALADRISVALSIPRSDLSVDEPLSQLGLDSLVAMELAEGIDRDFALQLPAAALLPGATIRSAARAAVAANRRVDASPARDFAETMNPLIGDLLQRLGLDTVFVRGEGSALYDEAGTRYVDYIAQYGALPFGYNPAHIWAAAFDVYRRSAPSFVASSIPAEATKLARRLLSIAPPGLGRVTFCNSGAEAIECAIKLCRARTGRRKILSTHGAFHGLTLGALSATGRPSYQTPFFAPLPDFDKIPFGDAAALEIALASQPDAYAAFIVEPIQGEGGVIVPPSGYLRDVARICKQAGVPFVLDEVQTGLGRAGTMFACDAEDVTPDVLTLAKALGGGLFPLGACVYRSELSTSDFLLRHGSTFANNAIACAAGLATIESLTADGSAMIQAVTAAGTALRRDLERLRERHPSIIKDVRGRGYLIGIELSMDADDTDQRALKFIADPEAFSYIISSYLLNVHRVRVAPTLASGGAVLRIEPSLAINPDEFAPLLAGLDDLCLRLESGDTAGLVRHLAPELIGPAPPPRPRPLGDKPLERRPANGKPREPSNAAGRFGFLIHLLEASEWTEMDPSLSELGTDVVVRLKQRLGTFLRPVVLSSIEVRSRGGQTATGDIILVPYTAGELLSLPAEEAASCIATATSLAAARGAQVVGLGGYTSVVTAGGAALRESIAVPLTTGNALTAAVTVGAIRDVAAARALDLSSATMLVVGALGSVGRGIALLAAAHVGRVILVGGRRSDAPTIERLEKLADEMRTLARRRNANDALVVELAPARELGGADPIVALALESDIVVTATSSPGIIVNEACVKANAIVCDVSRPPNVAPDLARLRPDVAVIEGGIVRAPAPFDIGYDQDIGRENVFACMAETMVLALENAYDRGTPGSDVNADDMIELAGLASKHGFETLLTTDADLVR